MQRKALTAEDIRQEYEEVNNAFAVFARRYPDYNVVLEPKDGGPTKDASAVHANGRGSVPSLSRRESVSAACREWKTIREIMAETGLDKKQVEGVLTAPDYKANFDKRPRANELAKEYRRKKVGQEESPKNH